MNKYNVKIFLVAVFFLCFLNVRVVFATLLKDEELANKNYTAVHIWNNKIKGGRSVGHAALQICENGKLDETPPNYISLYPNEHNADVLLSSVNPKWNTPKDDGTADTIVKLYSLNRQSMRSGFEKDKTQYTLTGNGGDSPFVDDLDSRNCAALVRDVLNSGGMKELFRSHTNRALSFPRALPATGELVLGVGLGIGGGIVGGGFGFLKGAVTLRNPFYMAWEDAKKAAKICSDVPLDYASRNFSVINYGHPCGECLIVTPGDILTLANDARSIEKTRFPKSKEWN